MCIRDSKIPPALNRIDQSLLFQLRIGPLYGIGIDGKLHGKLTDRRKTAACRKSLLIDQYTEFFCYLLIDRSAILIIQDNNKTFLPSGL